MYGGIKEESKSTAVVVGVQREDIIGVIYMCLVFVQVFTKGKRNRWSRTANATVFFYCQSTVLYWFA